MKYVPKSIPDGINANQDSPLADAAFLLTLTVVLVGVIFVSLGLFTDLVAKKINFSTETLLFQGKHEKSFNKTNQQIQSLVNKLWSNFEESAGSNLHVAVVESDQLNAFMTIGGNMQITTPLLEKVKYENELAFVICHEIGHFYNRDVLKGMGRNLGLAFILYYIGFGESMDLVSLSSESLNLAFDREQERAADEFALDCMAKNYGHVQGYDQFFNWVLKEEQPIPQAGRKALSFMQSHPLTESRMDHLKARIQIKKLQNQGKLTRLPFK